MDFRYKPLTRVISLTVLLFFCWSFAGGLDIAYAIKSSEQQSAISNQQKENNQKSSQGSRPTKQKPEEKFQKTIEDIEKTLTDTTSDTDTKKNKLKAKKVEIESLDIEIKKQFAATEKKLKDTGLPPEILERHHKFVRHYEDNLNQIKTNLNDIEKSKKKSDTDAAIGRAKAHLEKVRAPKKHRPLDPNKMPLRAVEPVLLQSYVNPSATGHIKSKSLSSIIDLLGNMLVPSAYAAELPIPDSTYLNETIEISLAQEIHDLADELGGTPVDLYEFIRNTFKYEPYPGSVKGAVQTLREKAGNEWDLASLLISLLRSKGIPARYVLGTIEIPIEQAMGWLRVENPNMAATLLVSNGRPTALITSGGKITAIETQHVWVQAYIPFLPTRGVASGPGDTWVNIDPSFKNHNIDQILDLSGLPSFDQTSYLSSFQTESPYNYYRMQIQNFLDINATGYKPEALMRESEINQEWLGILIGQLPYTIKSISATYSEVPDSFRQKFSISITDPFMGASQLFYSTSLPQIIGKRLTLSYIPATSADQNTIDVYGDIFSTPPYLIKLKPVIKLEGLTVAQGEPVGPGEVQSLTFVFNTTIGEDRVENTIITGEYYAIGLNAQTSGERDQILERIERIKNVQDTIKFNETETLDDRLGEILYLSAMVYHQNLNSEIHKICSLQKIVDIRQVSEIMYFLELKVDTIFGMPIKIAPSGITADFDRDIHLVIPVDGDVSRIKPYMILVGNLSSYLEHAVTEVIYQTEAISAVKAIQLAHDQGIPVHTITSQNINTELPMLQISEQVKADIRNAINAGKEAIVPERDVSFFDWSGVGYIIQDPSKGSGAYLISGGFGGSTFVVAAGLINNVVLKPVSNLASQANQRTIKRMVCFPGADNLLDTEDDTCYTEIAFGDIQENCGITDPGCRKKYALSNLFYAQPLIDFEEHVYFADLSKHVTAWDWQSQDNARYMRAGLAVLAAIESLMDMFYATKHNLRPEGSGYRTQDRNASLKPASSPKSHHMDGVAADIKLAYDSGAVVRKCDVLQAAYQMIRYFGEVMSEDTQTKKKGTVHIAVIGSSGNDMAKGFWRCK